MELEEVVDQSPQNHVVDEAVHKRIRHRLAHADRRYYANDNIADFIEKGELDLLHLEVKEKIEELLTVLVIDTAQDHNTKGTASRIAKMFLEESFRGRYESPPSITKFPNVSKLDELLVVGPITIRSTCAHHLCPISGQLWIGVMPNAASSLIGLSKYARLTQWVMSRPQIQEEAAVMLADELERTISPEGLALVIEATHFCTFWRGVKEQKSLMRNSIMRGVFLDNASLRQEFLALIKG